MKLMSGTEFIEKELGRIQFRGSIDISAIETYVKEIVSDVKREGDTALVRYTLKFDGVNLDKGALRVPREEISQAHNRLKGEEIEALSVAAENIRRFQLLQRDEDVSFTPIEGVILGQRHLPLSSIGIYTPGGGAAYSSSVLMCAIPAAVAGVEKIILCSPPSRSGGIDPYILAAADIAGVEEVFRVGGAQAIAAMAYGTETIPKVEKIVGPGNIYVNSAKLLVSRDVSIDLPAGPSEIVIIADGEADPRLVASDLLAQAEHDKNALAILLTDSRPLAERVAEEAVEALRRLERREIAEEALKRNGFIVTVESLEEAVELANLLAPEHLEILTEDPEAIFKDVRNAGAVFMGEYSSTVLGDYSSGLNHVLPTGGYSKTFSALSVRDFTKTLSFLRCNREGFLKIKGTAFKLACMEGLYGHAKALMARD